MSIILWIVFGGLVGWVASLMMGTDSQQGIFINIIVGIVGAIIGGYGMAFMGASGVTGFNFYSFAVALAGAGLFIFVLQAIRS